LRAAGDCRYNVRRKMDVLISISEQVADKLRQRAVASGQPLDAYTSKIVEQAVAGPTLEELLAPVQADFVRRGMTEAQLLDFGRELLDKVRSDIKD
jgi:hypothetical protein